MESKIVQTNYPNWQAAVGAAKQWLEECPRQPKILIEQNRNLGDTLHLTPVVRHYRMKYPDAAIAFCVGQGYLGAHEYNPHVNRIFGVPHLDPQERIKLRKHIITYEGIQVISPSIFPYGEVWKELAWSYPDIATQYFHNSGIVDLNLLGGRKLEVAVTDEDKEWARHFMDKHGLHRKNSCALEYNSYSTAPIWRAREFSRFAKRLEGHGVKCISLAGPGEGIIPHSIDGLGMTWRRTVALMNEVGVLVGVGSGITMLAASAIRPPIIAEIGIPDSVSMKGCGYANSIQIVNYDPDIVADHVKFKLIPELQ